MYKIPQKIKFLQLMEAIMFDLLSKKLPQILFRREVIYFSPVFWPISSLATKQRSRITQSPFGCSANVPTYFQKHSSRSAVCFCCFSMASSLAPAWRLRSSITVERHQILQNDTGVAGSIALPRVNRNMTTSS